MSRQDKFKKPIPEIVGYLNRYAAEVLHEPTEELQRKAEEIYAKMVAETPEIGGAENPMADNLYQFITFCAYYEASDHRIDENCVPYVSGLMMEKKKNMVKLINLNKKSSVWLMNQVLKIVAGMTAKKTDAGEWGNTWRIEHNPEGHKEGVCYVLRSCPLMAFAKAHGYENMMPYFCLVDHQSAALMHAKLIRFETEGTGGSCCDYWFVGDQSETAKKYADLPQK